jgi:hypothetical protein
MRTATIRKHYSDSAVLAAERLLGLIAPNDVVRRSLCERLHQELSEQGDEDYFSDLPILWILAQFSGFYVDWKDGESFKHFVQELAHDWGVSDFSFPPELRTETNDFLTVPELMRWARYRLEPYGLLLWHWNTEEDNYCGAISAEKDWLEVLRVCDSLGFQALPGDTEFGEEIDA